MRAHAPFSRKNFSDNTSPDYRIQSLDDFALLKENSLVFPPSRSVNLWLLVRSKQNRTEQCDIPGANLGSNIVHEVADHLDVVTRHHLTKIRIAYKRDGAEGPYHLFIGIRSALRPGQRSSNIGSAKE